MDLGLKDKLIVVTGGGAGIGAAITTCCIAEGARVVVLSRRNPGVTSFFTKLQSAGATCELIELELGDFDACREAVERIEQKHGDVFALVNNAGVNDGVSLSSGSLASFEESLRNNLTHAFVLAQACLPGLKRSRGAIINISSKVAVTGQGGTSGYAAAKGAMLALTRDWAAELLPFGIRVNAVLPAEVMTPLYESWLQRREDPEAALAKIEQVIPLGQRMTTPAEIASAVVFLLSPSQSAHTTAQHVIVDGGYVHLDRALSLPS